jgi:hypothetical protein
VQAVGKQKIDYRFLILYPITGYCYFKQGITALKQVTELTQRDLQHCMVAVIIGAAPPGLVRAIRALMYFRYLAQAPIVDEDGHLTIEAALAEFHEYKECNTTAGARCGKQTWLGSL